MGYVDADAHVIETEETWAHLSEADKEHTPLIVRQYNGPEVVNQGRLTSEYWVMDNRLHAKDRNVGPDTPAESREMRDVGARIAHMDALGIDLQVLYPTVFLRPAVRTAGAELALTQAYNRWLGNIWKQQPDRLRWVAMPSLLSLDRVRDEIAWAKDNGACGIFMRGLEWDRHIADPYFYPLYEIASELELPICIHSGTNSITQHDFCLEDTSFTKFLQPGIGAFQSLVARGVPSKFSDLRWGFVELSAQWLPYIHNDLIWRLQRAGKKAPDNILTANRIYVTCSMSDDVAYILKYAGEDNLMLGTDYGHNDQQSQIDAFSLFRERNDIAQSVAAKITEVNPRALYAF
jgi:predicted TIM-barrel fold metal-dependent hydrolase